MSNLAKQLALVLDGRITYGAFVTATREIFERLACRLIRHWTPPAWVTAEDLVQELYLGAWTHVWHYEPILSNGTTLERFVIYNAMSQAKRELHRARGAKLSGCADKNPSNMELPISSIGMTAAESDALAEALLAVEPEAETEMVQAEERQAAIARALDACVTKKEHTAMLAIVEAGDIDGGAIMLYRDFDTRIALRLSSEEHAVRFVARTAITVMSRIADLAS